MTASRARGLALAGAVAVAVAVSGCGGGSATTSSASQTSAWADGMCSALVSWRDHVKAAGAKVSDAGLSKAALQDASKSLAEANTTLRHDLEALGTPPTPAAKKAKTQLQQLGDDLTKNADKIREAFANVSDASGVAAAATTSAGAVEAMGQDVKDTAAQLRSLSGDDAWSKAFESSKACQSLTR